MMSRICGKEEVSWSEELRWLNLLEEDMYVIGESGEVNVPHLMRVTEQL